MLNVLYIFEPTVLPITIVLNLKLAPFAISYANSIMADPTSRSTIGGGRGCRNFVLVLGGDGAKIVPPGDILDQSAVNMSLFRGKLVNHVGDHVALSPEGVILINSPGMELSYPRPPPIVERLLRVSPEQEKFQHDDPVTI